MKKYIKIIRERDQDKWHICNSDFFSKKDINQMTNATTNLSYFYRSYFFEDDFENYIIESNKDYFIIKCESVKWFIETFKKKTLWKSFSRSSWISTEDLNKYFPKIR